ncbi:MAG: polyribonucleotide nucleotidyltransferase [Candidatus Levybacteria bacterium RIFCSPHIGHO2_01_FULL_37_17]|nr:MAG: polyribonucleotide nucleotidyltransferase [Candidatus Levybacteria bacterium RIFCSPHIGHO2_01_FULL_37_17]OGH37033.1 MAG: polyribonucleotide nucleotidyltransferase [Candidatus Levybacteria bacterium RIFCSPLOWO2_01_FULL_38_23]
MKKTSKEIDLAGKKLILEIGEFAEQATSSILARLGETVVLVTVVEGGKTDLDYFPLSVDYVERLYAGGRIKGSRWVKREGRPSDEAILAGRLIDRSIRPLFPKSFKNEVQIIVTVMSVDGENEADVLALNAVSAALAISRIPWNGPIGAIRVGYIKENGNSAEILENPTTSEIDLSELDMVVSQTKDKTVMLEAGAKQVSEDVFVEAIGRAQKVNSGIVASIEELVKEVGTKKLEISEDASSHEAVALIDKSYKEDIIALIKSKADKESGGNEMGELVDKIYDDEKMKNKDSDIDKKTIVKAIEHVMFKQIRIDVLEKNKRVDGRKMDEIRPIAARVGILPRTHGSALFQRGLTQALSVITLGSPRMEQLIESAEGEESKSYIHHYSGLPYSFGQTGRVGTPSRREIGHGALAERALEAVIPKQETFPYTIRVVSEVLSQNGSSSMASTCGSTLALMDAGVPILKPVAGISIGMMSDEKKYQLLTDIIGIEDFSGDMDFKVAGTENGVTAIQVDVKIPGLTIEQVKDIFAASKKARLFILDKMQSVIPSSRKELSEYAPKIEVVHIPVDKIGEVIGPGGKVIKNIIATTGATVDVEDDGSVTISGTNEEAVQRATDWVKSLTRDVGVGEEFEGEVKRILPFGAFVEILPGKEGMVHVSKMSTEFVNNPSDVVEIGQKVKVRVAEIDEQGRINLSMLFGADAEKEREPRERQERSFAGSARDDRGPRREHPLSMQFKRERQKTWQQNKRFGPKKPRY